MNLGFVWLMISNMGCNSCFSNVYQKESENILADGRREGLEHGKRRRTYTVLRAILDRCPRSNICLETVKAQGDDLSWLVIVLAHEGLVKGLRHC